MDETGRERDPTNPHEFDRISYKAGYAAGAESSKWKGFWSGVSVMTVLALLAKVIAK